MTKRHSSKYKIDRRQGVNLWGRPKSPYNKRQYAPGEHGQTASGKKSDYGNQLYAKQRLKGYYANISEKRFRRYYEEAVRRRGDTSENLIGLLESRLDSVIYRAKFVPTVFAARQFISHGHILVNNKKVTIASYNVKPNDVVQIASKSQKIPLVIEAIESTERDVPEYIQVDLKALKATYIRLPKLLEVPYPVQMEPNLVIEFYSR